MPEELKGRGLQWLYRSTGQKAESGGRRTFIRTACESAGKQASQASGRQRHGKKRY